MDQNVCFSSGVLTTQSSAAQIELWLVGFGLNNVTTQSIQKEKRKNRRQSKGSVNVISEALGLQSLTFTVAWAASSVVSFPCDWLTVIWSMKYDRHVLYMWAVSYVQSLRSGSGGDEEEPERRGCCSSPWHKKNKQTRRFILTTMAPAKSRHITNLPTFFSKKLNFAITKYMIF